MLPFTHLSLVVARFPLVVPLRCVPLPTEEAGCDRRYPVRRRTVHSRLCVRMPTMEEQCVCLCAHRGPSTVRLASASDGKLRSKAHAARWAPDAPRAPPDAGVVRVPQERGGLRREGPGCPRPRTPTCAGARAEASESSESAQGQCPRPRRRISSGSASGVDPHRPCSRHARARLAPPHEPGQAAHTRKAGDQSRRSAGDQQNSTVALDCGPHGHMGLAHAARCHALVVAVCVG